MFSVIITTRYWDAGNAMRIHWCAECNVPKSDAMQVHKSVYQETRLVTMLSSQRESEGRGREGRMGRMFGKGVYKWADFVPYSPRKLGRIYSMVLRRANGELVKDDGWVQNVEGSEPLYSSDAIAFRLRHRLEQVLRGPPR
jgi:hypothetical protein